MLDVLLYKSGVKTTKIQGKAESDSSDRPLKSLAKTVSWRIIGTIDTMVISYIITGEITHALSIGSIEVFSKMILYYFHERMWAKMPKFNSRKDNKE